MNKSGRFARVVLAFLFPLVSSCEDAVPGSEDESHDVNGVDSNKRVSDLSEKEVGLLCDYSAELAGVYDSSGIWDSIPCGDSTMHVFGFGSHDSCISNAMQINGDCHATVAMWEECAKVWADVNLCDPQGSDVAYDSPECKAYYEEEDICFNRNIQ